MPDVFTPEQMIAAVGQELALSPWQQVDQARIDAFAQVSGDHGALHIDPVAAAGGPFGAPVAHGMLTLSLLVGMASGVLPDIKGAVACVNCGFDKVRFARPVHVGAQLRGRYVLRDARMRGAESLICRFEARGDVRDAQGAAPRVAVTARWMLLYSF